MSKIPTKHDYLKQLRDNKAYAEVLKKAPDEATRKKIIAMTEHIAGSLYEGIFPVLGMINSNPEMAAKISEALKTGDNIIKESSGEPIVSGSKG